MPRQHLRLIGVRDASAQRRAGAQPSELRFQPLRDQTLVEPLEKVPTLAPAVLHGPQLARSRGQLSSRFGQRRHSSTDGASGNDGFVPGG